MAVYTVHEPPARHDEFRAPPERFRFVRDGFHFWAFVAPPLWMLRHRLWLVLIGYIVVVAAIAFGGHFLGLRPGAALAIDLLLSLLVGLEAGNLRRWTFGRRGWQELAVVSADKHETAERRFFDNWESDDFAARPASNYSASASYAAPASYTPTGGYRAASGHSDVVGMFPEPGTPR